MTSNNHYHEMDLDIVKPDLLIVGGDEDPNLIRMMSKCGEQGVHFHTCLKGKSGTASIHYDLQNDVMVADQKILKPKSVFIRMDVFAFMRDKDASTWNEATEWASLFYGWMIAHEEIKVFNRALFSKPGINKTAILILAKKLGLKVPQSHMTNSVHVINANVDANGWIKKPVEGGDYTTTIAPLDESMFPVGRISSPVIIQEKLDFPEMRVYRVGRKILGFKIQSRHLDYRQYEDSKIELCEVPADIASKMMALTDYLQMDYGAADFKTCPKTKDLVFLEINTNPMFAGFDNVSSGILLKTMIDELTDSDQCSLCG